MTEYQAVLERAGWNAPPPNLPLERVLRRRDRRRRGRRITAGVVGMAVFVAAVWIVRDVASLDRTQRSADGRTPTPTPTRAITVGPVPRIDYFVDLDTGQMTPVPKTIAVHGYNAARIPREYATSPDGSRLALSRPGDNGNPQIFVANLDGTRIEQVTHDVDAAYSPAWSPDGSKIAYIGHYGDRHDLFVLDLATGTSTQLTFGQWNAFEPSFTADGSSILFGVAAADTGVAPDRQTRIVSVAGGESMRLMRWPQSVLMSPDGSLLSYGCGLSICVANVDGSEKRSLVNGGPEAFGLGGWSPDGTRITYDALHSTDVYVMEVATGQATYVAKGFSPTWVDDHTLIIEMNHCYNPALESRDGCGG